MPAFIPRPQGITALWPVPTCTTWWTEAHRCEKLAQGFYAACPAEIRTHDLSIASPILYRQRHDATAALVQTQTYLIAYLLICLLTPAIILSKSTTIRSVKRNNARSHTCGYSSHPSDTNNTWHWHQIRLRYWTKKMIHSNILHAMWWLCSLVSESLLH